MDAAQQLILTGGTSSASGSAGGGPANAETTTWVNAVVGDGGTVSAGRQTIVDNLITSLKGSGHWANTDRLWLFGAENTQSALRDIKTTALASVVNAPTFTANQGYAGNGTSSYVDSGAVLTAMTAYTLNAASLFTYIRTSRTTGQAYAHGVVGANGQPAQLFINYTSNNNFNSINNGNATGGTDINVQGGWVATRVGANDFRNFQKGVQTGPTETLSAAVAVPTTRSVYVGARNNNGTADNFSADQFSILGIGGGFNTTDAPLLDAAINSYMTSLGTNVY